jgi:hypothetical protein
MKSSGPQAPRISRLLAIAATLAFCAVAFGSNALAEPEEVECGSIRISMTADKYDQTCEDGGGLDYSYQSLEANATDGSHFLVIADFMADNNYVFNGQGLRASLADIFDSLEISDWKTGKIEQGLTVSEFASEYKAMPSSCVAFQKYVRKSQWGGGWRRHVIGFGCSRSGNRQEIYDALKLVEFP